MKHNRRDLPPLDLKIFSHDKERGVLTAEASDFGGAFRIQRLYSDACDEGIAIRSHLTGKTERFALSTIIRQSEDLLAWEFLPVDHSSSVAKVVIFND